MTFYAKLNENKKSVAKIPKFVYDERVRKTFVFVVSILILFVLNFSFPKTSAESLPPCSKWVYAFPTDSPRFGSNSTPIPTGSPDYVNSDFKDRKCIEVQTGIGNISTEPQGFVKSIFSLVLGLAGGIALILIMISGYSFMTSRGDPEAIKAATGRLTSAIIGLLFIIFSFVILEIIGVDILRIPGFGK